MSLVVSLWSRIEERLTSLTDGIFSDEESETLAAGRAALEEGRPEDAIDVANSVLLASPDSRAARLLLALSQWELDLEDEAVATLEAHLASYREDTAARIALARMLVLRLQPDKALANLGTIDPRDNDVRVEVELLRGRCYLQKSEIHAAKREFDSVVERTPDDEIAQQLAFVCDAVLHHIEAAPAPDSPRAPAAPSLAAIHSVGLALLMRPLPPDELQEDARDAATRLWQSLGRGFRARDVQTGPRLETVRLLLQLLTQDTDAALHTCHKLLSRQFSVPLARRAIRLALAHERFDSAAEIAGRLLQQIPDETLAIEAMAAAELARGNLAGAIAMVSDVVVPDFGLTPHLVRARIGRNQLVQAIELQRSNAATFDAQVFADEAWRTGLADEAWSAYTQLQPLFPALLPLRPAHGNLRISIVGEFSAGKSTIINTLLGSEVSDVGAIPVTNCPMEVQSGMRARRLIERDDGSWVESEQLEAPADARRMLIEAPTPHLAGVTLIDNPGVNTKHSGDPAAMLTALQDSDAVIWVFRATQAGKQSEAAILKAIAEDTGVPAWGIINQADLLAPDERDNVAQFVHTGMSRWLRDVKLCSATQQTAEELHELVLAPILNEAAELRQIRQAREAQRRIAQARQSAKMAQSVYRGHHEQLQQVQRETTSAPQLRAAIQEICKRVGEPLFADRARLLARSDPKLGLRASDVAFLRNRAQQQLHEAFRQFSARVIAPADGDMTAHLPADLLTYWRSARSEARARLRGDIDATVRAGLFAPGALGAFQGRDDKPLRERMNFIESGVETAALAAAAQYEQRFGQVINVAQAFATGRASLIDIVELPLLDALENKWAS